MLFLLGLAQLSWASLSSACQGLAGLCLAPLGLAWVGLALLGRALLSLLPAPVISKHKQHCGGPWLACTFDMSSGTDF